MKRDMDLIRSILLNVESDGKLGLPDGHTNTEIADHAQQLKEAGLVEAAIVRDHERHTLSSCNHSTHVERARLCRCHAKSKLLDKDKSLRDEEFARVDAIGL
jgi:hypothetical protein